MDDAAPRLKCPKFAIVLAAAALALAAPMLVLPAFAGAVNRGVRVVQASIPMPDGVLLAATLYMPADLRPH